VRLLVVLFACGCQAAVATTPDSDAGPEDAGTDADTDTDTDADTDTDVDGDTDSDVGGDDAPGPPKKDGCGCRTAGGPVFGALALVGAAIVVGMRRRRAP